MQNKKNIHILVVDDDAKFLNFIKLYLKINGYDVTITETGRKCLEALKTAEPDIMLLDIILPDIDGFNVLRQLRQCSAIPVIAWSATPEYSSRALKYGANVFMEKSFNLEYLLTHIQRLTDHQKRQPERL